MMASGLSGASADARVATADVGGAYLAEVAEMRDPTQVESDNAALWREVRRFNPPAKMALAAAHRVLASARAPAEALLISLSPCRLGSPELWRASLAFETGLLQTGRMAPARVNPTYALHAIDNLALSALAQSLGNHGYCVGLGGAPGQAWCGLEVILERLGDGAADEALLFAGEQGGQGDEGTATGVALLFSRAPRPFGSSGRAICLRGVERGRDPGGPPRCDAVMGLHNWLTALAARPPGRFLYPVPAADGDGVDRTSIVVEVQ